MLHLQTESRFCSMFELQRLSTRSKLRFTAPEPEAADRLDPSTAAHKSGRAANSAPDTDADYQSDAAGPVWSSSGSAFLPLKSERRHHQVQTQNSGFRRLCNIGEKCRRFGLPFPQADNRARR